MTHLAPAPRPAPPPVPPRHPARPGPASEPSMATLTALVARELGVPPRAVVRPTRGPAAVALARQTAMYLAHVALGQNFSAIGRAFGRDRTTAAHACRIIEETRDDPATDARLGALERALVAGREPAVDRARRNVSGVRA